MGKNNKKTKKNEIINICAISDLHGYLPNNLKKADLLLICGDIVPLNIQTDLIGSYYWLFNHFIKWCEHQPFEKIIFIGGNHDFFLDNPKINKDICNQIESASSKVKYVKDKLYTYTKNGINYNIYGTPYCEKLNNFAFMNKEEMIKSYNNIPFNLDILLTHDAPKMFNLGVVKHTLDDVGNKLLADIIKEKQPRLTLSGHIHSGQHGLYFDNKTYYSNVSLLNEEYEPEYKPTYIKYDKNKGLCLLE